MAAEQLNGASKVVGARERFLARLMDAAIERRWRTPDDFLKYFPPGAIIDALARTPEVRTRLLVEAARIPQKIAVRHSPTAAREDLQIAFEEGLTNPAAILALIPSDIRARVLDPAQVWSFALGGEWLARAGDSAAWRAQANDRVRAVIDAGVAEKLIGPADFLMALSNEEIAAKVPVPALRKLLVRSLDAADHKQPLDRAWLVESADFASMLADLPPEQTWHRVVVLRLAMPLELPATPGAPSMPPPSMRAPGPLPPPSSPPMRVPSQPPPAARQSVADMSEEATRSRARTAIPRIAPRPVNSKAQLVVAAEVELGDDDLDFEPSGTNRRVVAESDGDRRQAVIDHLVAVGRLPPNQQYLSLAILRSIARMYSELKNHKTKAARTQCVRDCFDSPAHLRAGMSALLELLEPETLKILPDTLRILGDAGPDTLVDAVLLAEKSIWQRARNTRRA